MSEWRDLAISAGFAAFRASRVHRLLAPWTTGRGAILMFHHVRPARKQAFAPNRLLEITPEFLAAAIGLVRQRGFDIVTMDEAVARLARPSKHGEAPFAVLTFDDGYWDNRDFALPVLQRLNAPFTLYITTGFADRSARLWWRELEAAVGALERFALPGGQNVSCVSPEEKSRAFDAAYWILRGMGEAAMLDEIASLAASAGVNPREIVAEACMDWDAITALSQDPLCSIGVHTLTHPMLAKHDAAFAEHEMRESRALIERRIGKPALHLSYPVGDRTSAGAREFAMAQQLGFASAVTTRPGMVLPAHVNRLHALPRLSVNGKWQSLAALDVLLSGAPFALLNKWKPG